MNIAIIMAGGTGSRMAGAQAGTQTGSQTASQAGAQGDLPKQFLDLGGKPIIMHSLTTFLESGCFDAIYIGMHPDWVEYMGDLISGEKVGAKSDPEAGNNTAPTADSKPNTPGANSKPNLPVNGLHIISGGADRNATLLNVLDAIESDLRDMATSDTAHISEYAEDASPYAYGSDPIIVTHDAARPFVTAEMIEKSIDAARSIGAATVAIPATDTIAVAGVSSEAITDAHAAGEAGTASSLLIREIPDRKNLFNIQTPQSFRLSAFRDAYSELTTEQSKNLTDVSGVFVAAGKPVAIVQGDPSNIKITTSLDLKVAETVLL